jgi:hypothetical protein
VAVRSLWPSGHSLVHVPLLELLGPAPVMILVVAGG